jgi:DNA-binding response OmpR family regulator
MTMSATARRVLIVEDDSSIARLLRANLQFEGFSVEWLPTGRDALALSHSFAPDLVLLDLTLAEGVDGLGCAAFAQGTDETR